MRKILWLTNKIIPTLEKQIEIHTSVVNEGWINQMFQQFCNMNNVRMSIVCGGAKAQITGNSEQFSWFTIREGRYEETYYSSEIKEYLIDILKKIKPDIIHIWGTEYPHTLAMVKAAGDVGMLDRVVISLQGLISVYSYSYYYHGALPDSVISRKTLFDIIRKNNIEESQKRYAQRGKYEIEAISMAKHCIGRTDWDRALSFAFNQDINYHLCNETLRTEFYNGHWEYEECEKYSIFVSQATYPIKGFHLLLKALPTIVEKYPNTHVYVAGEDIVSNDNIKKCFKSSTYGKYLGDIINRFQLNKYITFLGKLDAEKMKIQYLNANVFVSCSSIENSSNSIGEAMILGVPVVASDVGGTRSIIKSDEEGLLYKWDSIFQLSNSILSIFENSQKAIERADKAYNHAHNTHNPKSNFENLIKIYDEIDELSSLKRL